MFRAIFRAGWLAGLIGLSVVGCGTPPGPKAQLERLEREWRKAETRGQPIDRQQVLMLARTADFYARQYPKAADAPRYALLAARLFDDLGRHGEALLACELVRFQFGDSPEAADATLLFAQVLHLDINDRHRAELAYDEFLRRWPEHPQRRLAEEALTFFRTPVDSLLPDSLRRQENR